MKKKLALLTAGALLSAAAAVPASAAVARRDANAQAQARQVEPLKGAARDMPLGQAIHAIVPREFTVRTSGVARELLEQPVSWSGGRAWTEVLEDLLDPYPELALEVALGARRVTVRQLAPGAGSAAARAEMEQAMRREARAESLEALPRTRAVLTQRGAMADAVAVQPQPASHTAQEATLAVMQMAIQTTTQTAIQSAVQAALQYANQTGRPGGGRESQAATAPAASTVPPAAPARTAPAPASAATLGGAPGTGATAGSNAGNGNGNGNGSGSGSGGAASAAPSLGVPAAAASSQQAPSAARAAGSGGAGAPAAATALAAAGGGAAATAASNAPAAAKTPALPTWEILPADRSVRTALERWTASAGWQLSWELAVDYPVAARTSISGSFETAVEAVAQSLGRAEVPVKAIMYRGNRVLRIVAKGAE